MRASWLGRVSTRCSLRDDDGDVSAFGYSGLQSQTSQQTSEYSTEASEQSAQQLPHDLEQAANDFPETGNDGGEVVVDGVEDPANEATENWEALYADPSAELEVALGYTRFKSDSPGKVRRKSSSGLIAAPTSLTRSTTTGGNAGAATSA